MRSTANSINRCLVWCGLLLSGCATPDSVDRVLSPDPQADQKAASLARVSRAMSSEIDGRTSASVSNLLAAVAQAPDDEELRYRAAFILLRQSRFTEAQRVLRDAVTRHPRSERDWIWLGWAYRTPDDKAGALQVYREGLIKIPSSVALNREYATLLIRDRRFEEAAAALADGCAKVSEPLKLFEPVATQLARRTGVHGVEPARAAAIDRVIKLAEQLQDRYPRLPSPTLLTADLHVARGEPARAVEILQHRQRSNAGEALIDAKLIEILEGIEPGPDAFEVIDAALARDPESGALHRVRATLLAAVGDDVESRNAYEEATRCKRPSLEAFLQLAELDSQSNNFAAAMEWLRRAEAAFPGDPRPYEALCTLQLVQGRGADALTSINRALQLSQQRGDTPAEASLRLLRIFAQQEAGQPAAAARALASEVSENSAFLTGFSLLALQSTSRLSRARSIETITHLQALDPLNPEPLIQQGMLHSANADWTNALACFDGADALLAETPGSYAPDAQFYYWYGACAERLGHWDRAAEMLQNAIMMDPSHGNAMNYLAYMWAEQGSNLTKALEFSRRSLALEPENAAYIDTLGWIYFKQGKLAMALREIQRAANLIPDDPSVVEHLGDVLAKMDKRERALQYWKRSFVLDPTQPTVREKLLREHVDLAPLEAQARARATEMGTAP